MKAVDVTGDWLPLDNAAKIYPSTASLKSPAEFRLTFCLKEPVRLLWLQRALKKVMPRFPYFQVYLRRGFFWYYLQRNDMVPEVEILQNVPLSILSIRERNSPLLRVSARERTIAVDFSHILTDGNGGMRFLFTLAAEYLRQGGIDVGSHPGIMDPNSCPAAGEFEDAHRRNFEKRTSSPEKMPPAYHMAGSPFRARRFRVLNARLPVSDVLSLARHFQVTLTEYLSALYVYCLMEIYDLEKLRGRKQKRSIIRLEIPVDMRQYFPSETMRNFSLYLSPEINMKLGKYGFDEIVTRMHHSIQLLKNRKQLSRQISRNVGSELNPAVRYMPLAVKDILLSSVYSRLGEALHSGVLSNLGVIRPPSILEDHIESVRVHINPNHVMKKGCAVLTFKEQLSVSFTSVIESTTLERLFFSHFTRLGIPVQLEEL